MILFAQIIKRISIIIFCILLVIAIIDRLPQILQFFQIF